MAYFIKKKNIVLAGVVGWDVAQTFRIEIVILPASKIFQFNRTITSHVHFSLLIWEGKKRGRKYHYLSLKYSITNGHSFFLFFFWRGVFVMLPQIIK